MEVTGLKTQVEGIDAKFSSLSFRYSNPGPGFDPRKGGRPHGYFIFKPHD